MFSGRRSLLLLAFIVLANSLIAGAAGGLLVAITTDEDEPEPEMIEEPIVPPTISEIVAQVSDTVVTVIGKGSREEAGGVVDTTNVGSGIVLPAPGTNSGAASDGFIVTNEHVIAGAEELIVVTSDGEQRSARLVGDDRPYNDLAVIVTSPEGLVPATIGDSDLLSPGQPVVALGQSLFTLPQSVSTGVVSGIHRRFFKDNVFMEDLIQTDAAINQGNSGGALLNLQGEVVGMLTTVVRTTGNGETVEGIAFAISSRTINDVAFQLIARGRVRRPDVGLETQEITVQQAGGTREAAIVVAVDPLGPAAAAGVLAGDVVLSINEDEVSDEQPFLNLLKLLQPGEMAALELSRNAQTLVIEVEVAEKNP